MRIKRHYFKSWIFLVAIIVFIIPNTAFAASTGTSNLLRQFGSGYSSAGGDYISASIANGGLNQPYHYYIEVPAGLNRLRVSIFDADVGRGSENDWLSGSWNTSCTYTLYDPSGTNRGSITGSATQGNNGAWQNILSTTSNLIPGHWQLVVNMTSAVTTGDDLNGYGIRADNGDATTGGTELNVYAESFIPIGRVGTGSSTNTFYPYFTSGCTVDYNDWDGDNLSTHTYRSRTGENTGSFSGSGATAWRNNPILNYETDLINNDTGIWTWTGTYTDTGAGGNFGVFYAGNYQAADPPPTSQPQADTFRVYLPRDGAVGNVPNKPFITQKLSFVSGPNPPAVGNPTRVRVEIAVF
ncbi:MAG: hypothetical protein MUC72_11320, partial [Acidobacteria bacterium]|nr:hypothetical protein [Acidobacteriota bacterium]